MDVKTIDELRSAGFWAGGSRLPLVFGHPVFWNPSNDYNAYGLGLSIGDLGSEIGNLRFQI